MSQPEYGASNIKVLKGLEAVRKDQVCILVILILTVYTI